MKVTCFLPIAALFTAVAAEPIPARGALVKKDEDCETNATTNAFEVDPTSTGRPTQGYGGFRPPYGPPGGYGTHSWGVPSPSESAISGSPISSLNSTSSPSASFPSRGSTFSGTGTITSTSATVSFSDRPRSGTESTSSTEGSPIGPSNSTSTAFVTQTITLSSTSSSSVSGSFVPVTNATSPSGRPTAYSPPPYGYFPVPSGVDSSTEGSPATDSDSPYPTPCNETTASFNTAPTAPISTGKTTVTLPLTLTTTLTSEPVLTLTLNGNSSSTSGTSPLFSIPSAPRSGNDTSSAPGTGTSASPVSPITATGASSSLPVWTGMPTGYHPHPYGPYPPFPISSRPRSGTQSPSGYGTGSISTPVAPVTGTNSTSSLVGPTRVSSSISVTRNVTISTGTRYTVTIPLSTGGSTSSTEGSPVSPSSFSNFTSPLGPTATITSQTTSTGTLTYTVPGITTITGTETYTLNTTITISGTGSSSSTEGSPATPSIPLSTGETTTSHSGPAPYPYLPFPSAPSSSSTEVGPVSGTAISSSIPLSTGTSPSSSSTEASPIDSSNTTSSLPGTYITPTPYNPFTPFGAISSSTQADAISGTAPVSLTTSAFTTIFITPRTTLTSATATNTPYLPSSAARVPGSYGGPPPGYGEGYRPEGQGWFGGWGRVVGN